MKNLRRIRRWFNRLDTNPYYIVALWMRFDDWCRPKEQR